MERRFDDTYGKVYDDETGLFLFSYYECGISPDMSTMKKNELVEERQENFLNSCIDE